MGAALICSTENGGQTLVNGNYAAFGGCDLGRDVTEANWQMKVTIAGTFSKLGGNINATGGSRSLQFRQNTANGNQLASIADAASGWFEDASNSDSVSSGDLVNVLENESGTNPTLYAIRTVFTASSGHACFYQNRSLNNWTIAAGVTNWLPPNGSIASANTATEANSQCRCRSAGTLTGAKVYVASNATTGASTVKSNINGTVGSISVSITAAGTGLFEDNSNSDALADGDDWGWEVTNGGGGNLALHAVYAVISYSAAKNDLFTAFANLSGGRTSSATMHFWPITGYSDSVTNTTEANAQIQHGFSGTMSRLRGYVASSTSGGTTTIVTRVNGSNGAQAASWAAAGTGLAEDTSNSDAFNETDAICIGVSGGTAGGSSFSWLGLTEVPSAAPAAANKFLSLMGVGT